MIETRPITLLKTLMHDSNQVTSTIKITLNLGTSFNILLNFRYNTKQHIQLWFSKQEATLLQQDP